ncbi:hypothetical protein WEH80_30180 [Actinomycetes bacterium KLBMP 9759]
MSELHMKGYVLELLSASPMWDDELAAAVMEEYGLAGDYWYGTVRLTLTDLYSSGLLDEVETKVTTSDSGEEKLLFRFALNDFGRERMRQSGLAVAR